MSRTSIMPIVGVRPQLVKSALMLDLLKRDEEVCLLLVHSGQHYDYEMSKLFFHQLALPRPICNLNVGGGSHAVQTAKIMMGVEEKMRVYEPDVVVVFGDANTTLAGTLTAVKLHVPVCHVESGLRSQDMAMPEEVNRVLTDHCSHTLYTPTLTAFQNLKDEGIDRNRIVWSGDTMCDVLLQHRRDIEKSCITDKLDLTGDRYAVLTVHRPENVDNPENLANIVSAITELKEIKMVFPVHPRTQKQLEKSKLKLPPNIVVTEPLGYFDMLNLIENSAIVLTDSGGVQKEAFMLHVPCVTLRCSTEWVETIMMGANKLVGCDVGMIVNEVKRVLVNGEIKVSLKSLPNPYGDGKASQRIVEDLKRRFSTN